MRTPNLSMTRPGFSQQPDISSWVATFGEVAGAERGRRLHLISEPGSQPDYSPPVTAEGASCTVIFDGVLYNRAELRERLPDLPAATTNDADLVLRAYLRWGQEVPHKIKGVFALIIWDGRSDTLLCVRDPLGIYPLFYADAGSRLLLSTSTEALVRQPGVSGVVNRAALVDRLSNRQLRPEETYLAAVRRVPPGHAMRVDGAGRQVYRHWDPAPPGAPVDWIGEEELGRFDELLEQAVDRCLTLGPAGIYLSGGLDSVSVAAVAADLAHRKGYPAPWALSLAFPHPEANEEGRQSGVARGLGLPQELIPLNDVVGPQGLLQSALEMCGTWPTPMANPWRPGYLYLASEGKRRGCQVVLTGDGGDDWLTVNFSYMADLLRALDVVGMYRLCGSMLRSYQGHPLRMLRFMLWRAGARPLLTSYGRRAISGLAPGLVRAKRRREGRRLTPAWVAPDVALRREVDRRVAQRVEESMRTPEPSGRHAFYLRSLPSLLGSESALMSMDHEEIFESGRCVGLRVLHPYWDPDLIDFLFRTPPELLLRGGREKGMVRQAVARRFPHLGFERQRKVSATNYFKSVLQTEGPAAWEKMGGAPALVDLGIVDGTAINSIITESISSDVPRVTQRGWQVLSLEAWTRSRLSS